MDCMCDEVTELVVAILLTVFDMGTDIMLANDYCENGDPLLCTLTTAFISVPLVTLPGLLCSFFCGWERAKKIGLYWKTIEMTLEAGPQMILTLYVMTEADIPEKPSPGGKTSFIEDN